MEQRLPRLKVDRTRIVDGSGRTVVLKGVCLGGWLMMEGYMTCGRNIAERDFKSSFEKSLGKEALDDFTRSFRDNFIQEHDIRTIKSWGANCVRVPFNYRLIEFEDRPFSFNEEGLGYMDRVVEWCDRHGLYCILDMHAAPGAQNTDWHADCSGNPDFFANPFNQDRYLRLWRFLADRYQDINAVAGFDVLNEPLVGFADEGILKDLYSRVIKEIRDVNKDHIIFLEGNFWGQRISFLGKPIDKNTVYSIHTYPPAEYVFNWENDLEYPGKVYRILWNKNRFDFFADRYNKTAEKAGVPLYIGEFGINWRGGGYGEARWVDDITDVFKRYGFHWTYWTYKTVANSIFPDGIFRYVKDPPWVHRRGPVYGWETFSSLWNSEKGKMISSWRTENFELNTKILSVLKKHF